MTTSALAIAGLYGSRAAGGILDAWLVDTVDQDAADALNAEGLRAAAVPLWMTDDAATAAMVRSALRLAAG